MDKFIVTENKEKGFITVQCEENHYITNWDKQDIMKFTDAKIMYAPIGIDLSAYYCITDEEHNAYMEEQRKQIEEQRKQIEEQRKQMMQNNKAIFTQNA